MLTFFSTGADPKSVLCAFFKQGQCLKGAKCKFSHDLNIGRKGEKRNIYEDTEAKGTVMIILYSLLNFNNSCFIVYYYHDTPVTKFSCVIIRVLCTNLHDLHLNLFYWILIRQTASSIQNQAWLCFRTLY